MAKQRYSDDPYGNKVSSTIFNSNNSKDDDEQGAPSVLAVKCDRRRFRGVFVIIFSIVGFVVTVVGLTFFAARWSRHTSSFQQPENRTHKTQTKQKNAVAYKLDFPALYPDITSKPSSECRAAWGALTSVPCHDRLFDRASDNSTRMTFGWDPMYFIPRICEDSCKTALKDAYSNLSAKCSSTDMFILQNYNGMFSSKWLESGPAAAVKALVDRTEHLCRSSPTGDSDYEYCPVEMLERFSVIDGMNTNLAAVNVFISNTDKKRTELARWNRGTRGTGKYSYRYSFRVRKQAYGPEVGETSCGWCTFDFLNRTLNSWAEGAMFSPDSHQPVSLSEFIRRVRAAGERCAPISTWDKIYEEAITRYISAGLLPTNWEKTLPSGDLQFLIKNGPSLGDSPVSNIAAEYCRLASSDVLDSWNGSFIELSHSKDCLSTLEKHYLSAKCYINIPQDTLAKMVEDEDESKSLREAYCSQSCSDSLNNWPAFTCLPNLTTPLVLKFVQQYLAARRQRDSYCNLLGKKSHRWNCAQGLLSMKKTSWAFTGRPETPVLLTELEKALEELNRKLSPEMIRPARDANQKLLVASEQKATRDGDYSKKKELGNSVCAGCIWNWLTGNNLTETMEYMAGASSAAEYVAFVKKYHTVCTSLGATWLGGVPYGNDPVIWRVEDERKSIVRYIDAPKGGWHGEAVYGVNEATGAVFFYEKKRGLRPGSDIGSLWHVLRAERGLKAAEEGRFEAWNLIEEKHRKEADKTVWDVNGWGDISYIGPENGLEKKKVF